MDWPKWTHHLPTKKPGSDAPGLFFVIIFILIILYYISDYIFETNSLQEAAYQKRRTERKDPRGISICDERRDV